MPREHHPGKSSFDFLPECRTGVIVGRNRNEARTIDLGLLNGFPDFTQIGAKEAHDSTEHGIPEFPLSSREHRPKNQLKRAKEKSIR
jgi:hypothetical protein